MDDEQAMKSTPTMKSSRGDGDRLPPSTEKKREPNALGEEGEKKQKEEPRVVILAGPHKTASSSTQQFIRKLQQLKQKNHNRYPPTPPTSLLAPFQWPSTPMGNTETKQFSNLVKDLYEEQQLQQQKTKKNEWVFKPYKKGNVSYKEHYRNEFQRIWSHRQTSSNSIVLGAELWGPLSLHEYGPGAIRELMTLLPSNKSNIDDDTNTDTLINTNDTSQNKVKEKGTPAAAVTVALNYRTPRFDHLFSIYRQSMFLKRFEGGASFRDWMCEMDCALPDPKLNLRVLNTLGQALVFRRLQQQHGDEVVVVDMSGVAAQGMDIREVYACDILHLDACKNPSSRNRMLAAMGKPPKTKNYSLTESNTKIDNSTAHLLHHPLSETLADLEEQINEVLRKLDCSYFDAITSPNSGIRLLYSSYNASYCPAAFRKEASSFTDGHACLAIQKVLQCPASNFSSSLPPPSPPVPTEMKRSDIRNTASRPITDTSIITNKGKNGINELGWEFSLQFVVNILQFVSLLMIYASLCSGRKNRKRASRVKS